MLYIICGTIYTKQQYNILKMLLTHNEHAAYPVMIAYKFIFMNTSNLLNQK